MSNGLTNAENAALVMWTGSRATHTDFMAAVREAIRITERRYEQSEDRRTAVLREELAAVRDLAYRGHGAPADALEAILSRANAALR